jgi:hypothetical protein
MQFAQDEPGTAHQKGEKADHPKGKFHLALVSRRNEKRNRSAHQPLPGAMMLKHFSRPR